MTITQEWVEKYFPRDKVTGLSYRQCAILKMRFPVSSGWRKKIVGKEINDRKVDEFLSAMFVEKPSTKKRFDISQHKPNVQPTLTEDGKHVIITDEWLRSWMTSGIGINTHQRKTLNVNVRKSGWLKGIIGEVITLRKAQAFMNEKYRNIRPCGKKLTRSEETKAFIETYLKGTDDPKKVTTEGQMTEEIRRFSHCHKGRIIQRIKKMPYKEFLRTPYWRIISAFEKYEAGRRCAICGSTKMLNVHHKTYIHHGSEAVHLDDLVTVCRECHKAIHGIKD